MFKELKKLFKKNFGTVEKADDNNNDTIVSDILKY